ncbi:LTOR1 protein, partial [Polypterus senegalus]
MVGLPTGWKEGLRRQAAMMTSLAGEGAETTLTEFPRCFWSRRREQPGGLRRCYNCRRPGHERRYCPRGDRKYTVPPRFARGQGQRIQGPDDASSWRRTSLSGPDAPPQKSSLRGNCGRLPASRPSAPQADRRSSPDSGIMPRGPAGPYGLCGVYTQPCWIPWAPPGVAVGGLMGSVVPYDPGVRHGHVTGRNIIDVAAADSQGMEQHEYMDKARQYSSKLAMLSNSLSLKKPSLLPSLTNQPHQVLASDPVSYSDVQQSELISKNNISDINSLEIAVPMYIFGIIHWKRSKMKKMDTKNWKLLIIMDFTTQKQKSMDSISRERMVAVDLSAYNSTMTELSDYTEFGRETFTRLMKSHVASSGKGNQEEVLVNQLRLKTQMSRWSCWKKKKPLHGQYYHSLDRPFVQRDTRVARLKNARLKGETDSLFTEAQDEALGYGTTSRTS